MPENLNVDFENVKVGRFTDHEAKGLWNDGVLLCGIKDYFFYKLGITPHPQYIDEEGGNHYLKVIVPAGFYGPVTGAQWKIPVRPADERYLSFKVKFEKGFDFVKGGKLPGLAGGAGNSGGRVPDGYDGWSVRMMFWEGGKLSFYAYLPNQSSKWGERLFMKQNNGDTLKVEPGNWHTIVQYIKMNTVGKANGTIKGWFDGQEVFCCDTILFRKDEKLRIDQVLFSVFMGGDDLSWASLKTEYICFDDFRVSNQEITR